MSEWREIKLKDVCEKITVGHVGSMAESYQEAGIPFLRSLNIKPFQIDFANLKFIDEHFHRQLKKSSLVPNDVAVVRTGYPGTACVIPKSLGTANCSDLVIIRPSKDLNPHFLAAIFNSTFGQRLVSGNLVGAAQQHFNITVAKELKLRIPSKAVQDKIAAIFSAYNDLIENNNKRIALLEKAAEEIYREWFVRMRFPGWDKVKFVKGVPEGWEIGSYTDFIDVMSGGTPKTDVPQYWGDDIPWFTPRDLHDSFFISDTERRITEDGLRHCASKLYPPNTTFITARGTVGNCVMNVVPMALSQTSYALLGKNNLPQYFVYYLTLSMVATLKQQATGAVFDTIIVDTFRKQTVLIPTKKILEKYISIVTPMLEQLKTLQKQNEKLKQSRDLLLSRLISGKLSVKGLDVRGVPSPQL